MSDPYVGEIRMFGGNFSPVGWAMCDGALLSISENDTLFNLIGTTYGGDGQSTFGLPDLRGRVPLHQGQAPGLTHRVIGQMAGAETVTLSVGQTPSHSHSLAASQNAATTAALTGNVLAQTSAMQLYRQAAPTVAMSTSAISASGGSQPHDNMQPYLGINFIISLFGVFPSQN